jgi:phage shock protein A
MSNGILGKLFTLGRGAANNLGEMVVDANAITILEQEMRDADAALAKAREALVTQKADRKVLMDKMSAKTQQHDKYNTFVPQLLAKNDEALAQETAGKIAALENELAQDQKTLDGMNANIDRLDASIRQGEQGIAGIKRQIDSVKATAQVQRAQEAVSASSTGSNSKIATAMDSLERIKARQAQKDAQLAAAAEVEAARGDGGLDQRLRDAGALPGATAAADVLARFKTPQP